MYLGDGHIMQGPRAYVLRVFLNQKQCDVIERVETAMTCADGRARRALTPVPKGFRQDRA
jgi:hypothetical protein